MIRYNPNSPEILGKKQYNVLNGFACWCISIGISITFYGIYFLHNELLRKQVILPLFYLLVTINIACLLSGPYFFVFGLFIILRSPKITFYSFMGFLGIILLLISSYFTISVIMKDYVALYRNTYEIMNFLYVVLLLFAASFFWFLIIRVFRHSSVKTFFLNSDNTTIIISENKIYNDGITLFNNCDPLSLYGFFWFIASLFLGGLTLFEGIYWSNATINPLNDFITSTYFALFCVFLVTTIIGYGLFRHKEWARMLFVLVHSAILLLILAGFYIQALYFINAQIHNIKHFFIIVLMVPIAHWCYFVIRTLTSPLVKYVCLRGGHDID